MLFAVPSRLRSIALCAFALLPLACGDRPQSDSSGDAAGKEVKAEAGVITGRVTMADGSPLRGDVKEVQVSIVGITEAGEKVSYSPAVKPDGTYRQKVAPGQYSFSSSSRIKVQYGPNEHAFPLEPVGPNWNKSQDAAEGIVQNWVWKVTGPTPYGQSSGLDDGNATHWYGMSVGLRADGYRNDIGKTPTPIPDGTKLTFTFKPQGKAIDGSDVPAPVVFERTYQASSYAALDANDLPPAPYELTATATLPDGAVKPLLLQGKGDYPGYKPAVTIAVEKDNIIGGLWKPPIAFVLE